MNKRIKVLLITFITVFGSLFISTAFAQGNLTTSIPNLPSMEIYRVYNPETGEHLYTPSQEEVRVLTQTPGHSWNDEGIGWYAPRTGEKVYRLFNVYTGDHLYTLDQVEINTLVGGKHWKLDFGGDPAFYSGGTIPIYRLFQTDGKTQSRHLLTISQSENTQLQTQSWSAEGIAIYSTTKNAITSAEYPIGPNTIENVPSYEAIEADCSLTGTGTGYHAKIVAGTGKSAVSFGIQYDIDAAEPFNNYTSFIIENIASNDPGNQVYTQTGYSQLGKTFKLLLTVREDGVCDVFVNGNQVGSVTNSDLAADIDQILLHVEGSARINGDTIVAKFSNIKLKTHGIYDPNRSWNIYNVDTNTGLHSTQTYDLDRSAMIYGTMEGFGVGDDWDSAFRRASANILFSTYELNTAEVRAYTLDYN